MKLEILISLAVLASFGFPASVGACSIIALQRVLESRVRNAAETRLHADVIVVGYLSDFMTKEYKSKKETPAHVYEIVSPKKVLRGITKKIYHITVPRHNCNENPPRKQLIQLYLNKQEIGWDVVAYDRLNQ